MSTPQLPPHSDETPTVYPGLRHVDSATAPADADPMATPRGLLKAALVIVACATAGYLAFATPTEAETPAADKKAEKVAEKPAEGGEGAPAGGAPQAMPISVAVVNSVDITRYAEFSGRLRAVEDVEVRPRVSGFIDAVNFAEGDTVEKGKILFTIDRRPFQARYNTAVAAVVAAEASVKLAEREIKRARALLAEKALSQREFDERQSALDNARATLTGAQAQKDLYALDLEFAEVRAPITGRIGRPEITVGNTVRANEDIITTMQSINPVYLDFDIDEATYLGLMKSVRIDNSSANMPVAMALADENDFTRQGRIKSFDNQLLATSGTMRVRAEFDNTDGLLTPGLFARVRLGTPEKSQAIIINDSAINTDQSKRFVYVVGEDGTVQYREVKQGPMHPMGRIIESGLQSGEKIIVNGLLRARPGMKVTPMIVDMTTLKPAGAPPEGMAPPAGMDAAPAETDAPAATPAEPQPAQD